MIWHAKATHLSSTEQMISTIAGTNHAQHPHYFHDIGLDASNRCLPIELATWDAKTTAKHHGAVDFDAVVPEAQLRVLKT